LAARGFAEGACKKSNARSGPYNKDPCWRSRSHMYYTCRMERFHPRRWPAWLQIYAIVTLLLIAFGFEEMFFAFAFMESPLESLLIIAQHILGKLLIALPVAAIFFVIDAVGARRHPEATGAMPRAPLARSWWMQTYLVVFLLELLFDMPELIGEFSKALASTDPNAGLMVYAVPFYLGAFVWENLLSALIAGSVFAACIWLAGRCVRALRLPPHWQGALAGSLAAITSILWHFHGGWMMDMDFGAMLYGYSPKTLLLVLYAENALAWAFEHSAWVAYLLEMMPYEVTMLLLYVPLLLFAAAAGYGWQRWRMRRTVMP
jgi:hypothetical protein